MPMKYSFVGGIPDHCLMNNVSTSPYFYGATTSVAVEMRAWTVGFIALPISSQQNDAHLFYLCERPIVRDKFSCSEIYSCRNVDAIRGRDAVLRPKVRRSPNNPLVETDDGEIREVAQVVLVLRSEVASSALLRARQDLDHADCRKYPRGFTRAH